MDDGFVGQVHTYPAVTIAAPQVVAPAAPASDDGGPATGWLWGAGGALLLALAVLGADRRRRRGKTPHALEPAA